MQIRNNDFQRILCHNCNGVMIPEVHKIVDGVFMVVWRCMNCGSERGAIIGGGL